jgi:hypothetical protein
MTYHRIPSPEEVLLEGAAVALKPYGQSSIQYLAAELARPDLIFVPFQGRHADVPHVVDYRHARFGVLADAVLLGASQWAARLNLANPGVGVRFALTTNAALTQAQVVRCRHLGLEVFQEVQTAAGLAAVIRQWAAAPA